MFNHILTSIIGSHYNIQDAIKYFEDDSKIIAVVADGLGSKEKSADGARLICKLIVEEMKDVSIPLNTDDIKSITLWYEHLECRDEIFDEYCTTCSFVVIDKITKQISIGQIGDSPIFACIDDDAIVEMRQEKDFSNVTDCIGTRKRNPFVVKNYSYNYSVKVLVASDGIGDELESSSIASLFSYLSKTYNEFSRKSRSRRFTKEIKSTIGKVNNDDKSAIYIWST